jgi:hypothetical protein
MVNVNTPDGKVVPKHVVKQLIDQKKKIENKNISCILRL